MARVTSDSPVFQTVKASDLKEGQLAVIVTVDINDPVYTDDYRSGDFVLKMTAGCVVNFRTNDYSYLNDQVDITFRLLLPEESVTLTQE
jgi:hypothetical protein